MTESPLRAALRARLKEAMKARDAALTGALRNALGALDNATAVPTDVRAGATGSACVGVGAMETARHELSPAEEATVVRAEAQELLDAPARDDDEAADRRRAAGELLALLP